ncbi:MAG: dipeptide epimerase [Candidatus Hydrogenedentota bacterium]|nr:MAG: dipeptide epimerase [Candidatus Hydrogenedentota bacterium]
MRITQFEAFRIKIPFKRKYVHAEAGREECENVVVRIRSDGAMTGIGETIPREYLTGETPPVVLDSLSGTFAPRIVGARFTDFEHVLSFLSDMVVMAHERSLEATFCAVDLAMIDLAGKHFPRPASDAIGRVKKRRIHYTGPISGEERWSTARTALKLKLARFSQVKVKVGIGDDEARLSLVRRIMGSKVDIRIDANCAWQPEQAIERIERLKRFGISSVEQPVAGRDFEGMRFVHERCGLPVIADESVCSLSDALLLAEMNACDIFNVRLAKCGGIMGSLKIVDIARQNSLKCQLGCLVGETSILAAAGRHFAFAVPDLIHVEGSYNRHLLRTDIALPRLGFGLNGSASPLQGYGLGIRLDEGALAKCTIEQRSVGE